VLAELLRRGVELAHCLVRAPDEPAARARLRAALAGTTADPALIDGARVRVVCGDLAAPGLGLSSSARAALLAHTDAVVHAAADVDFLRPYAALRAANVGGTRAVVELCAAGGLPLHFVSSIGVFSGGTVRAEIREDDALPALTAPGTGYVQSKRVAELFVRAAAARGLRAAIYRPGRLVGDSVRGLGNPDDFVQALACLCRDLGAAPAFAGRLDLTPVDWAAAALAHLALRPRAARGQTFHLVHPEPVPGERLFELWRAAGKPLQPIDAREFARRAAWFLRRHPRHPSARILPFLLAPLDQVPAEPSFRSDATRAALAASGPRCPAIDRDLVSRWLAALPGDSGHAAES
jgi:thioester reductase-like protein